MNKFKNFEDTFSSSKSTSGKKHTLSNVNSTTDVKKIKLTPEDVCSTFCASSANRRSVNDSIRRDHKKKGTEFKQRSPRSLPHLSNIEVKQASLELINKQIEDVPLDLTQPNSRTEKLHPLNQAKEVNTLSRLSAFDYRQVNSSKTLQHVSNVKSTNNLSYSTLIDNANDKFFASTRVSINEARDKIIQEWDQAECISNLNTAPFRFGNSCSKNDVSKLPSDNRVINCGYNLANKVVSGPKLTSNGNKSILEPGLDSKKLSLNNSLKQNSKLFINDANSAAPILNGHESVFNKIHELQPISGKNSKTELSLSSNGRGKSNYEAALDGKSCGHELLKGKHILPYPNTIMEGSKNGAILTKDVLINKEEVETIKKSKLVLKGVSKNVKLGRSKLTANINCNSNYVPNSSKCMSEPRPLPVSKLSPTKLKQFASPICVSSSLKSLAPIKVRPLVSQSTPGNKLFIKQKLHLQSEPNLCDLKRAASDTSHDSITPKCSRNNLNISKKLPEKETLDNNSMISSYNSLNDTDFCFESISQKCNSTNFKIVDGFPEKLNVTKGYSSPLSLTIKNVKNKDALKTGPLDFSDSEDDVQTPARNFKIFENVTPEKNDKILIHCDNTPKKSTNIHIAEETPEKRLKIDKFCITNETPTKDFNNFQIHEDRSPLRDQKFEINEQSPNKSKNNSYKQNLGSVNTTNSGSFNITLKEINQIIQSSIQSQNKENADIIMINLYKETVNRLKNLLKSPDKNINNEANVGILNEHEEKLHLIEQFLYKNSEYEVPSKPIGLLNSSSKEEVLHALESVLDTPKKLAKQNVSSVNSNLRDEHCLEFSRINDDSCDSLKFDTPERNGNLRIESVETPVKVPITDTPITVNLKSKSRNSLVGNNIIEKLNLEEEKDNRNAVLRTPKENLVKESDQFNRENQFQNKGRKMSEERFDCSRGKDFKPEMLHISQDSSDLSLVRNSGIVFNHNISNDLSPIKINQYLITPISSQEEVKTPAKCNETIDSDLTPIKSGSVSISEEITPVKVPLNKLSLSKKKLKMKKVSENILEDDVVVNETQDLVNISSFPSPHKDSSIMPCERTNVVIPEIPGLSQSKNMENDVYYYRKRKKLIGKSDSLLGKAFSAINNLKSNNKLFAYEVKVGIKIINDSEISGGFKILNFWKDPLSGTFYINCSLINNNFNKSNNKNNHSLKLNKMQNYSETSIIIILCSKPNGISIDDTIKFYYPIQIFKKSNNLFIIPYYIDIIKRHNCSDTLNDRNGGLCCNTKNNKINLNNYWLTDIFVREENNLNLMIKDLNSSNQTELSINKLLK